MIAIAMIAICCHAHGMTQTDTAADVAALLIPLPDPPDPNDTDDPHALDAATEAYQAAVEAADGDRTHTAEQLRLAWEEADLDPLIAALRKQQRAKADADANIRVLLAYGREIVHPRPYRLIDLAEAAGMSISGTRTGYDHRDVDTAAERTGRSSRDWRAPDPTDPAAIQSQLADLADRYPADPHRAAQVFRILEDANWTAHAPDPRTPGTPATRRYLRWERTWPNGTKVTLYQEHDRVAASGKIHDDDTRRFHSDYATHDPRQLSEQLDALARRVDQAA
jgi:hypothetical protein